MDVVELKAQKDFRLDKLVRRKSSISLPRTRPRRAALDKHWERLPATSRQIPGARRQRPQGRVPLASMGVARFHFDDLCDQPLGANDYLHIAHAFHTVIIDDIPLLTPDRRDVARRFINLVDALYDSRICLIASAAAEPMRSIRKATDRTSSSARPLASPKCGRKPILRGHSGGRARR